MNKQVAIIGSSGGNLYNQGGNNPRLMIKEILTQAQSAGIDISYIQFIGATSSMDNISKGTNAKLYTLENGEITESDEAPLNEINEMAKTSDKQLADKITNGEIDAMMLLSCDPKGVNNLAITAAAAKKIPLVGTGGTSIANTQSLGGRVISASGTTGTTNRTRAVAFVSALAKEWKLKYMPVIVSSSSGSVQEGSIWKRINFRGIMMAAMPGFISMALVLALSKIPAFAGLSTVFDTLIGILPVVLAAIAAKQVSGMDEVGLVAGIIAGILAKDGGIIGGMIAGILAGILTYYISSFCFKHKVPGTTANIASGGISGLTAGLTGMYLIAPAALWFGNSVRWLIDLALNYSPILAGAVAGLLIWPAIIGGVYHAAILPIILLEMEKDGFSFLGAIDMTCLVMVSAGITLANVLFPKQKSESAVALPGFIINIAFGTFVEASYPFMFSSKKVFGGALAASTIAGAMVGWMGVKGTAYVPAVVAPMLANPGKGIFFLLCMLSATGLAFLLTTIANQQDKHKLKKD